MYYLLPFLEYSSHSISVFRKLLKIDPKITRKLDTVAETIKSLSNKSNMIRKYLNPGNLPIEELEAYIEKDDGLQLNDDIRSSFNP